MAAHPCLERGCGAIVNEKSHPRCPRHTKQRRPPAPTDGRYGAEHVAMAKRTIGAHVLKNGWTCPGWRVPEHAVVPGALTADHIMSLRDHPELARDPRNLGVLCRPVMPGRAAGPGVG